MEELATAIIKGVNIMNKIPTNSQEIQVGLWLHSYLRTINGVTYMFRHLYSSEGYCFYDRTQEVYREKDGESVLVNENEILPHERQYMRFASLGVNKDLNDFISTPIGENFEIV